MKQSEMFELRKYAGNLDSLFGYKDYTFNDGPARGMRAFDLRNGTGLDLTVVADRGLDIASMRFKGVNIGFDSKVGLRSPALYVEDGVRGFLKQFNAGMLTTCGITYAGGACQDGERALGLHGPYNNTPAANVSVQTEFVQDEAVLCLRGQVREACVFEENMVLFRQIRVHTQRALVEVIDEVENQGFAPSPMMLVYHINFGYPLLNEGARVYANAERVQPRDEWARKGLPLYDQVERPEVGREEQCYFHTRFPEDGRAFAMLHNEALGLAGIVRFDSRALPLLCQWKCMRAGEYALGLEPTTSGVLGRTAARESGMLVTLAPGQRYQAGFSLEITDDLFAINAQRYLACLDPEKQA